MGVEYSPPLPRPPARVASECHGGPPPSRRRPHSPHQLLFRGPSVTSEATSFGAAPWHRGSGGPCPQQPGRFACLPNELLSKGDTRPRKGWEGGSAAWKEVAWPGSRHTRQAARWDTWPEFWGRAWHGWHKWGQVRGRGQPGVRTLTWRVFRGRRPSSEWAPRGGCQPVPPQSWVTSRQDPECLGTQAPTQDLRARSPSHLRGSALG